MEHLLCWNKVNYLVVSGEKAHKGLPFVLVFLLDSEVQKAGLAAMGLHCNASIRQIQYKSHANEQSNHYISILKDVLKYIKNPSGYISKFYIAFLKKFKFGILKNIIQILQFITF